MAVMYGTPQSIHLGNSADVTCVAVSGGQLCTWDPSGTDQLQNGSSDAIALYDSVNLVLTQFISYEGVVTASNGPANGNTSTDVGVAEGNSSPNLSVQYNPNTMMWFLGTPNGSALPVELNEFNGYATSKGIELYWSTLSEVNNEKFELKHSTNNIEFNTLAYISAKGNTYTKTNYSYLHNNLSQKINYYKLIQYDYNGQHKSLGTIVVESKDIRSKTKLVSSIVSDQLRFQDFNDSENYFIYDIEGKIVMQGTIKENIDITSLHDGQYFIFMGEKIERFVKM
jgi:hypothetical protein